MKIYYKSIILDEKENLINKQVIEENRQYKITYCCEEMKQAIKSDVIDVVDSVLCLLEREYDGMSHYFPFIKYCPFCGEPIEQIEVYRAKLERHPVRIPKKTIPAHTEVRNKEVRL